MLNQVLSVGALEMSGPLKIQEGHSVTYKIAVLDDNRKPIVLPTTSLTKLGMQFKLSDTSTAEYDQAGKTNLDASRGILEVSLKGKKLGEVSLWVELGEISSNILHIQVNITRYIKLVYIPSNK